jgi:hypothetical protein
LLNPLEAGLTEPEEGDEPGALLREVDLRPLGRNRLPEAEARAREPRPLLGLGEELDVDADLRAIVERALEVDPEACTPDAEALALDLRRRRAGSPRSAGDCGRARAPAPRRRDRGDASRCSLSTHFHLLVTDVEGGGRAFP